MNSGMYFDYFDCNNKKNLSIDGDNRSVYDHTGNTSKYFGFVDEEGRMFDDCYNYLGNVSSQGVFGASGGANGQVNGYWGDEQRKNQWGNEYGSRNTINHRSPQVPELDLGSAVIGAAELIVGLAKGVWGVSHFFAEQTVNGVINLGCAFEERQKTKKLLEKENLLNNVGKHGEKEKNRDRERER